MAVSLAAMEVEQDRLAQALATIQDATSNLSYLRRLQVEPCSDTIDWSDATNVAQVVQGCAFITLAMWLIFANNSKVAIAQKAPLEQRHAVCATISTAVALLSGFFNILQLTAIDDFEIPGRGASTHSYTLQLARPVEWIMTCPILQLKLVVLAGARVPSYRRFMMPLLSATILICGIASSLTDTFMMYVWFAFGCIFCLIMFYYNALQITENSEGEENWYHGNSDYRRLSILLILTWFPFPIWYVLSPEGYSIIEDELVIELGWVVLNMLAKFSFIILLQRSKLLHQRKLEAARELYGLSPSDEVPETVLAKKGMKESAGGTGRMQGAPADYGLGLGEDAESEEKLVELVADSMVTLGMPSHTDRLIKLLVGSGVTNTDVLERLNADRCMELCLPWALVETVQRRWVAEKMSMGQDQGGVVEKADPFLKLLETNKERLAGMKSGQQQGFHTQPSTPSLGGSTMIDAGSLDTQIAVAVKRAIIPLHETVMNKLHVMEENMNKSLDATQDSVAQRMDFGQVALMQTVNACQVLLHKLDSSQEAVLQKLEGQNTAVDQLLMSYSDLNSAMAGAQDNTRQALVETVSSSQTVLLQKLSTSQEELLRQSVASHVLLQNVSTSQGSLAQKVDSCSDTTTRRLLELENCFERKLAEVGDNLSANTTVSHEGLIRTLKEDLQAVCDQTNATMVGYERVATVLDERMADLRHQTIMILDLLTSTNETLQSSSETLSRLRAQAPQADIKDLITEQLKGNTDSGGIASGLQAAVDSMVAQIESSTNRLEKTSAGDVEEALKREFEAVAMALAQQQHESGAELRQELCSLKDLHLKGLEDRLSEVCESMSRFEAGLERLSGAGGSTPQRRRSEKPERG